MKTLALIIALFSSTLISQAQTETKGQTITVTINNVKNNNGKVIMSLHSSESFMKTNGVQSTESSIENNKVVITFDNVMPGEYAIMGIHDENDNKQMDFELNGMPKESYGMSNNPMSFGPPQFSEAKFTVAHENIDMIIRF